jgi:hypothetical protein
MGYDPENTIITFGFRWTGLSNRNLASWVQPMRPLHQNRTAVQDNVLTTIDIPLDTPNSVIYEFVNRITKHLFQVFSGFSIASSIVEELTNEMLGRKG